MGGKGVSAGGQRFLHIVFFFNDTATTEIYTLSLRDALPIYCPHAPMLANEVHNAPSSVALLDVRSEEHTSELQSRQYLVCRLLLEKKLGRRSATSPCTRQRTARVTAARRTPTVWGRLRPCCSGRRVASQRSGLCSFIVRRHPGCHPKTSPGPTRSCMI